MTVINIKSTAALGEARSGSPQKGKSSSVQDVFLPMPGFISCAGVTKSGHINTDELKDVLDILIHTRT